jgi:peptidoglycan/xylan/chitin deacetylase (PgdA/CDA1 family)
MYWRLEALKERTRRRLNFAFAKREVKSSSPTARISFTFDDFPRSAYVNGGGILNRYSLQGTYYTAMGLMNTSNHLGEHFTPQDLMQLVHEGHEIGCHTFDHLSCPSVLGLLCRENVGRNQRAIEAVLPGYKLQNFAYPCGAVDVAAKWVLGSRFLTCRSTYSGTNEDRIDMALLLACKLYASISWESVQELIEENTRRRSWLIFYTHDVRDDPSPYGCTPEFFEAAVKCAVSSGAQILTVRGVVEQLIRA